MQRIEEADHELEWESGGRDGEGGSDEDEVQHNDGLRDCCVTGGRPDEDDELEADEGGDGSDGEACGDAGGDDAASEQAGEDPPIANENAPTDSLDPESDFPLVDKNAGVHTPVGPLGCAYGCVQAGHVGGDLELMAFMSRLTSFNSKDIKNIGGIPK
eukprot:jgi/Tetstr1/447123/TSEL_034561.t1